MARPDQQRLLSVVQPHLDPGEKLRNCAIAYRKPSFFLTTPLIVLAVLPGLIAMTLLTRYFIVALTDRRLLILSYKGRLKVQEVMEYRLDQIPPIKTSTGSVHIDLTLRDPQRKFFCQFHRSLAIGNRDQALAIVGALQNEGFQRAPYTPPPLPSRPPPLPVELPSSNGMALRLSARRLALQPDTPLREDDIAGLLSQADDGIVAIVDRNPNNPSMLGLKNLSSSIWVITLPNGEKRDLEFGRSVKLTHGTEISFGFCKGVIES